MTSCLQVFSAIALLLGLLNVAGASPAADEAEAGKVLYGGCVACHGADGAGIQAMSAPALAGQDPAYLQRQLRHFKAGIRGGDPRDTLGQQMQGMAALLADDTAIARVVAYIASLPVPDSSLAVDHDRRNGEVQYNASCGACHGPAGKGNSLMNAPRLAGLDADYLRRQYRHFAEGIRGSHARDRYGRQMQMMATMLASEKDLDDVIGYLLAQ